MSSASAVTFGAPVPILRMYDEAATRAFYLDFLLAQRYRHARPGILEQDWGTREMIIDDPSGNRLVFFEPRA